MNIESDHFKTLEELTDTVKMWVKIEEEFYDRWFGLNEMNILVKEIDRLNKENKLLQDMDKILRNENTNLKLEIERLNNILVEIKEIINNKYWFNWEYENDEVIKEVLEIISKEEGKNEN